MDSPTASLRVVVLMFMVIDSAAAGHQSDQPPELYSQAAAHLQELTPADWQAIQALSNGGSVAPTPRQRELLGRLGVTRDLALRAANGDWSQSLAGCEFRERPKHQFERSAAATLLRAYAMLHIHDGDGYEATRSIEGLYRIAGQFVDDASPSSSTAAYGVFKQNDMLLMYAGEEDVLTPETGSRLLKSIARFDVDDPLHATEAVTSEVKKAASWYRQLAAEGRIQELGDYLGSFLDEAGHAVSDLDADGIIARLDQDLPVILDGLASALASSDAATVSDRTEQLRQMETFAVFFPWFADSALGIASGKAGMLLEGDREKLQKIIDGVVPENAAVWYRRAVRLLDSVDATDENRGFLDLAVAGHSEELSQEALEALRAAERLCVQGTEIERCQFDIMPREVLLPEYLVPLAGMMRAMLTAAKDDLAANRLDAAVSRMAVCIRMEAHLSTDARICSSVVAHDCFQATLPLVGEAIVHDGWSDTCRLVLVHAIGRMRLGDPFGYRRAEREWQGWLSIRLAHLEDATITDGSGEPSEGRGYSGWLAVLRSAPADDLLAWAVLVESPETEQIFKKFALAEDWSNGSIDYDVIRSLSSESLLALEKRLDSPILGKVESRMRVARDDLVDFRKLLISRTPIHRSEDRW